MSIWVVEGIRWFATVLESGVDDGGVADVVREDYNGVEGEEFGTGRQVLNGASHLVLQYRCNFTWKVTSSTSTSINCRRSSTALTNIRSSPSC